ncbi:MAG: isoprenylcysteine carboxylmethyltransferase family protein [Anaerolineae bacterium]|nr:isoprenylcysteine carboxylmethyltransferase family protein [Anaerolineae bacterium]
MEDERATEALQRAVVRRWLQVLFQFMLLVIALFVAAGDPDWVWGWVYVGVGAAVLALNAFVVSPEVAAERGTLRKRNVKGWDRVLSVVGSAAGLAIPIVAGLDERFDWSASLPVALHVGGMAAIVLGQGLFSWSMAANRFFSTMVRIQDERGHTVATAGPYRYVRHPGYVGYVVAEWGTALGLGSLWALIPVGLGTIAIVVRTALEDRTLRHELAGYAAYAARVRWRLVPGVW